MTRAEKIARHKMAACARAMLLVRDMNPFEARRWPEYLDQWPEWAQADVQLAYSALMIFAENNPPPK